MVYGPVIGHIYHRKPWDQQETLDSALPLRDHARVMPKAHSRVRCCTRRPEAIWRHVERHAEDKTQAAASGLAAAVLAHRGVHPATG